MADIVWLLEKSEDYEGGRVIGVYAAREAAAVDFIREAREIHRSFSLDHIQLEADGSIHVHGGCDNLTLTPVPVQVGDPKAAAQFRAFLAGETAGELQP